MIVRNGGYTTNPSNQTVFGGVGIARGGPIISDGGYTDTDANICLEGFWKTYPTRT